SRGIAENVTIITVTIRIDCDHLCVAKCSGHSGEFVRLSMVPTVLLILLIAGCVSSQKRLVDGLVDGGVGDAISVNYSKLRPGEFRFYSRLAGSVQAPI